MVGFFEADLVAHCGTSVEGTFLNTLVLTDIVSDWTEFLPLIQKSGANVIKGLETAIELLKHIDNEAGIDTNYVRYDDIFNDWYTKHKEQ